jgi:hypothetical protein
MAGTFDPGWQPFQWQTRIAENPIRRQLTIQNFEGSGLNVQTLVVDVQRSDGTVSRPGTPISCTNLNGLEGRIGGTFTTIATYLNNAITPAIETNTTDIGNIKTALEDVFVQDGETIELSKQIYSGILKYKNTGVYTLHFFLPINKQLKDVDSLDNIDLSVSIYEGMKLNPSALVYDTTNVNHKYSIDELGIHFEMELTNLLDSSYTTIEDTGCSVFIENNSSIDIVLTQQGGN